MRVRVRVLGLGLEMGLGLGFMVGRVSVKVGGVEVGFRVRD